METDDEEESSESHLDIRNYKTGERCALIGVYLNIILTLIKAYAGVKSGSSAIMADASHSAFDILASGIVYIGVRIAKRPPDKKYNYGYGKAESIASFIIALIIILATFFIIKSSYNLLVNKSYVVPDIIALYAAIISIISKEVLFRYTMIVGKKINSSATIANALNHRADVVSSIAAFIGVLFAQMGYPIADPICGIVVSGFIIMTGWVILKDSYIKMMDQSPDKIMIEQIKEKLSSMDGINNIGRIRARQSGNGIFVDIIIEVDLKKTVFESHNIATKVKRCIIENFDNVIDVLIHVDPYPFKTNIKETNYGKNDKNRKSQERN